MNSQLDFSVIKSQANFESIILQALDSKTTRHNGDEIRANCPFKLHDKKNSFSANIAKKVWNCFSCGEGGDIIEFIKKLNTESTHKKAAEIIQEQSGQYVNIAQTIIQAPSYTPQQVIDCWANASLKGNDTYFIHRKLTPPSSARFGKNPKGFSSTLMPFQDIEGTFKGFVCLDANSKRKYNYIIDESVKFMLLGELQNNKYLLVGEGIATVQTVWEAFDRNIAGVAVGGFTNMIPVLNKLTETYPNYKFIILFDTDKSDKINEIRKLHPSAICLIPKFQSNNMDLKDYNDIISKENLSLTDVRTQIENGMSQTQNTTIKPAIETKSFEQPSTTQEKIVQPVTSTDSNDLSYLLAPNSEEKLTADIKSVSKGISTGYTIGDIDLIFPGGAISVIAAPTSHGKTTALINFCLSAINENPETNAYFFSYEESEASILTSFLNTYISKIHHTAGITESLSVNSKRSIESFYRNDTMEFINQKLRATFAASKDSFFKELVDTKKLKIIYSELSIEELVAAIKFIKNNDPKVGIICIDYIQLLRLKTSKLSRQEQVKEICTQLKNCAVETGLPIVTAAQFNRTVTSEGNMSVVSIGEAGDIERIASLVIGMFNRNFKNMDKEGNKDRSGDTIDEKDTIYFEVLKGRNVGVGHNTVMKFHGNSGMLTQQLDYTVNLASKKEIQEYNEHQQPLLSEVKQLKERKPQPRKKS